MFRIACCLALVTVASLTVEECQAQGFRRLTVSPYLNLIQNEGLGVPDYQTLVRPMVEQRRRNVETERQISALQSAVVSNNVQDQRGEAYFRPTGHATGFFYYSHFYPGMQSSQRRR